MLYNGKIIENQNLVRYDDLFDTMIIQRFIMIFYFFFDNIHLN